MWKVGKIQQTSMRLLPSVKERTLSGLCFFFFIVFLLFPDETTVSNSVFVCLMLISPLRYAIVHWVFEKESQSPPDYMVELYKIVALSLFEFLALLLALRKWTATLGKPMWQKPVAASRTEGDNGGESDALSPITTGKWFLPTTTWVREQKPWEENAVLPVTWLSPWREPNKPCPAWLLTHRSWETIHVPVPITKFVITLLPSDSKLIVPFHKWYACAKIYIFFSPILGIIQHGHRSIYCINF